MGYRTTDEWMNFRFSEAYISEMRVMGSSFYMVLDNVTILPENSCNRDIREMRTNGLELRIWEAHMMAVIEEGYKIYDANGGLIRQETDRTVPAEEYAQVFKELSGCMVYAIDRKENDYTISIDTEDHTYMIRLTGEKDTEEWERFMSSNMM